MRGLKEAIGRWKSRSDVESGAESRDSSELERLAHAVAIIERNQAEQEKRGEVALDRLIERIEAIERRQQEEQR